MKKILICEVLYTYEDIKELKEIFSQNGIVVANQVHFGNNVSLFKGNVVFETGVKIGDNVTIGGNTRLGTEAKVGNGCVIGDNVLLMTCATIGEDCVICDGLTIGEENTVHPNTVLNYSKHIVGSVATATYTGNNRICIGCVDHSIPYWKKHSKEVGKKWKYTDKQIEEYEGYIEQIETFLKQLN